MAVISTGDFAKAVYPQMPKWYGLGYEQYPAFYESVFNIKSSDQAAEEDVLASGMGLMIQTSEGESTPYDAMRQGVVKQYLHVDYRLGVIITKNMIRDGKGFKIAEERSRALGRAHKETKNLVCANVLNRAHTAGYIGADGIILCSGSHIYQGGTLSNTLAVAADLSEASLEQARLEMRDIRDDRGLRIAIRPQKLVVAGANEFESHRILHSIGRVATADNDPNALKDLGMFPGGVLVWDHLTDADAFFILTNESSNGLTMYNRQELELSDDTHFDTDNSKFKGHARYSVGWTDWRHVFSSPGA